jgi:uncharacterized protein DUF6011
MTDVVPHFTDEELPTDEEFEARWIESALEDKADTEAEWLNQGMVFADIEPKPVYVTAIDWWLYADIPDPPAPCDRVLRFDLIGGGQIKVIEKFVWWDDCLTGKPEFEPDGRRKVWAPDDRVLHVTAHCGDTVKRARGTYTLARPCGPCEINCYAVLFPHGTDQDIVDRVAATFRAIGDSADHFFAMLIGGLNCAFCKRPLRDELSRLIGVGPDCARQHHIPHSKEAAEKRLALRHKLLGEIGQ